MAIENGTTHLLVDGDTGLVSRKIFVDEAIYALEQERVFRRSWLFIGHDSMIQAPGDFLSTYMGEEPVILWRGDDGQPRVMLNSCPHRGNKLCVYDRGRARSLTCSYHGWTFNDAGALIGVPFDQLSYEGRLNRSENALPQAKVATYGGLIYAAWEPEESLEEHLGEFRWWLDAFVCHDDFGGLAYLPSAQKYRMPGNWKLTSDNFVGDFYHVPISHASAFGVQPGRDSKLMSRFGEAEEEKQGGMNAFVQRGMEAFSFSLPPGHGIGQVTFNESRLRRDLEIAKSLDAEAVDYVRERHAKIGARVKTAATPEGFVAGTCFPNMTFQGNGAFEGELVAIVHPRGPRRHEIWQYVLLERDAPASVRRFAARYTSQRQSAAGLIGLDDGENFERIEESTRGPMASSLTFNYALGKERDDQHLDNGGKSRDSWPVGGTAGEPSRTYFSEVNQREFYRRWSDKMGLQGATV